MPLPVVDIEDLDTAKGDLEIFPPADDAFKGKYRCKKDGLIYARAIQENKINGRDYYAKNSARYWNGTQQEFEAQFVKE
jgi:hypothetical protein